MVNQRRVTQNLINIYISGYGTNMFSTQFQVISRYKFFEGICLRIISVQRGVPPHPTIIPTHLLRDTICSKASRVSRNSVFTTLTR